MTVLCLNCGYSITEPICASCVINEMKFWLYEKKINGHRFDKIKINLNLLLNYVNSLDYVSLPSKDIWTFTPMQCIKCDGDMHLMCFYCINKKASQIIKKDINKKDQEIFHESFNMDIYDYGLSKEQPQPSILLKNNAKPIYN